MIGANVEHRQRLRQVRGEAAPLPQASHGLPSPVTKPILPSISAFCAGDSGGTWKIVGGGDVEDDLRQPPEDVTTPIRRPAGRFRAWHAASISVSSARSDTTIARCARQQREGRVGIVRRAAGVGDDGAPRPLAAPDLEHHHRLSQRGRAIERRREALRMPNRFDEATDDLRLRFLDRGIPGNPPRPRPPHCPTRRHG